MDRAVESKGERSSFTQGPDAPIDLKADDGNDISVEVKKGNRDILIKFSINGLSQDVGVVIWSLLSSENDSITVRTTNYSEDRRAAVFPQKHLKPDTQYKLSFQREKPAGAREG